LGGTTTTTAATTTAAAAVKIEANSPESIQMTTTLIENTILPSYPSTGEQRHRDAVPKLAWRVMFRLRADHAGVIQNALGGWLRLGQ
jgi:hypothetical protein